jgi:putative transcriptional regulator
MYGGKMKTFIKDKRMAINMTQEELSQRLNVSRQTIISLEKGKYKPSLVLAHKLAQIFECMIEDLFIFEGDENID